MVILKIIINICFLLLLFIQIKFHLPVKSNFIPESISNVAVQQIVTNVCSRSFHPFNMNWSLSDIKIIGEELCWRCWSFPVELFGDVTPELLRSIDRPFVHILVLSHGTDVRLPWERLIWHIHRFPHLVYELNTFHCRTASYDKSYATQLPTLMLGAD